MGCLCAVHCWGYSNTPHPLAPYALPFYMSLTSPPLLLRSPRSARSLALMLAAAPLPHTSIQHSVPEFFDMHRALPDATAISISTLSESIDVTSSPERAAAAAGADSGRINIITELGPLTTHFLGTCSWLDDVTFGYSINTVRLDLGGRSFSFNLGGPLKLENELQFFLVTPGVACARSKLGGTMLLAPGPPQGKAYFNSW